MINVHRGAGPIILGLPHTGTEVPPDIWARLNDTGRALADTDWHVDRLYQGLRDDVSVVHTPIHRYVIDVNRPPDDTSLYPGQNTTGLCPVTDFDGNPIWRDGQAPSHAEQAERIAAHHAPYHAAMQAEIDRVKAIHGVAVLYDCHSIRSHIPQVFDGKLPDMNIGTNLSTTCSPLVEGFVENICRASPYSTVVNGRFKGGWTTRHYGRPENGVHALQMELAQSTYLDSEQPPWRYAPQKVTVLRNYLVMILNALTDLVEAGDLT